MPKTSKTPKDCKAPRPQNKWILFLNSHRKLVVVPHIPGETLKEHLGRVSKAVSELYRNLSEEDSKHWDVVAKEEKENHGLRNPNYRYKPRRRSNKNNEPAGIYATENQPEKKQRRQRQASPFPSGSGNNSDAPISSLALDESSIMFPFLQLHNYQDYNVRGTPPDVSNTLQVAPGFEPNLYSEHEFREWFQPPTGQQNRMTDEPQNIQPVLGKHIEEVDVINGVDPVTQAFHHNWTGESVGNYNGLY